MNSLLNAANWCGRAANRKTTREPKLLFLLGPPRSNSTLVHRLLAQHSEVVAPSLKELVFPGAVGSLFRSAMSVVPQNRVDRIYDPNLHRTGAQQPDADDIALLSAFSEGLFGWVYGGALKGEAVPRFNTDKHLEYLGWLRGYVAAKHGDKTVCSKYFAGVHHFPALQRRHPDARFVLLYRNPQRVCASLSTLIRSALTARGLQPDDPTQYWYNVYQYIVATYARMNELARQADPRVLVVSDDDVKSNLEHTLESICAHAELGESRDQRLEQALAAKATQGPYCRGYEYSRVLDDVFDTSHFAPLPRRQPLDEVAGTMSLSA